MVESEQGKGPKFNGFFPLTKEATKKSDASFQEAVNKLLFLIMSLYLRKSWLKPSATWVMKC